MSPTDCLRFTCTAGKRGPKLISFGSIFSDGKACWTPPTDRFYHVCTLLGPTICPPKGLVLAVRNKTPLMAYVRSLAVGLVGASWETRSEKSLRGSGSLMGQMGALFLSKPHIAGPPIIEVALSTRTMMEIHQMLFFQSLPDEPRNIVAPVKSSRIRKSRRRKKKKPSKLEGGV